MAINGQQTLNQIQAEIDTWMFKSQPSSTTTYPTAAQEIHVINKWYKRFCSMYLWNWNTAEGTFQTVIGQVRYAMPDNATRPMNLTIRNIAKSIPVYTRQKFLAMYPSGWNNTGQGIPMIAVEAIPSSDNSRQYDFWPAPNAVYTVNWDGFSYVTPLDGITYEYSVIPPDYDDILVHGPLSEMLLMVERPDEAEYHQSQVDKITQRAWIENENMISLINQARGQDADAGQALIFPYHPY